MINKHNKLVLLRKGISMGYCLSQPKFPSFIDILIETSFQEYIEPFVKNCKSKWMQKVENHKMMFCVKV